MRPTLRNTARHVIAALPFPSTWERGAWLLLAIVFVPLTTWIRLTTLSVPLLRDGHGRQSLTGYLSLSFLLNPEERLWISSPLNGTLSRATYEFGLYQWTVATLARLGLSLEVASRGLSLFFFAIAIGASFSLVRRWVGARAAFWSALLLLILPYNVIYSRSANVDVMALGLVVASTWAAFRAKHARATNGFCAFAALALVLGAAAAVTKVFVWYAPAAALGFYFVYASFQEGPTARKRNVVLAGVCLFQLACAVGWIAHTIAMRIEGSVEGEVLTHFVGELSDRFRLDAWRSALAPFRILFNDWALIPFALAIFIPGRQAKLVAILAAVSAVPFLVHFRVYARDHSHYALIQCVYLTVIVAIGCTKLFDREKRFQLALLAIVAPLLLYRSAKLQYVYGGMYADFDAQLAYARKFERGTHPSDIIENWEIIEGGGCEVGLYARRWIRTIPDQKERPSTALRFDAALSQFEQLAAHSFVWLDGADADLLFHRVRATADARFDSRRHVAASDEAVPGVKQAIWDGRRLQVTACGENGVVIPIATNVAAPIAVRALDVGVEAALPVRKFLSLPPQGILGCHFEICETAPARALASVQALRLGEIPVSPRFQCK